VIEHRSFWARRLHSLSGVFPIGAFLLEHFFTNSFSRQGAEAYNGAVMKLQSLPYVVWLEVFFIFLPILFHAIYGVYIARQARYNLVAYPYLRNWNFMLQRVTGFILFVYIAVHVWETRVQVVFDPTLKTRFFEHMQDILANPAWLALYIVGVVSASYHFANGLFTFGIVWGITAGRRAQQLASYACAGIFLVVAGMGISSLLGFLAHAG
jgi:succinate dehydrogenase / fumarate reductase cytochrome b subunit